MFNKLKKSYNTSSESKNVASSVSIDDTTIVKNTKTNKRVRKGRCQCMDQCDLSSICEVLFLSSCIRLQCGNNGEDICKSFDLMRIIGLGKNRKNDDCCDKCCYENYDNYCNQYCNCCCNEYCNDFYDNGCDYCDNRYYN